MSGSLNGKVALVTGGSRGIGAAIVRRLVRDGAKVAFTYTQGREPAEKLVQALAAEGGTAVAIQADATDAAAVTKAVDDTAKKFGRLDILVNNAGIAVMGATAETKLEDFDRMFAINVRGVFVATQAALRYIGNGGRIINIGSNVGERVAFAGISSYSATKGAVKMFTQGLARELGPRGITVNNVQPGPIDTDLNPASGDFASTLHPLMAIARHGHADELASMVSFVASPEASFVTGANLTVDGGLNA